MAFRKLMSLPIAALFFAGVLFGSAADPETPQEQNIPERPTEDAVAATLAEGEAALEGILGPELQTLDDMVRPMIREMAKTYGVSEEELALVAKGVMEKISTMDPATLQETMSQLAGQGGLDLENSQVLTQLVNQLSNDEQKEDEI